ncbi:RpiB/LacA/LacB family sugar-phosphate isomerase [Candidatus Kaiserbacteria bacterium]|nr:RpiB/LacA/LacB family sugar-phosphate isomerase [Candidatus Kaiserbacteria bacterium]
MPKVFIAADHAGFALKKALVPYIGTLGYEVQDMGPKTLDPTDDYPDFIIPAAQKVAADANARGIIIGKSGEGEAMCANRIKGARAAVFYGGAEDLIQLAREHNDANILSLGADFVSEDEAKRAVKLFLETPFSGDARHIRRLAKF